MLLLYDEVKRLIPFIEAKSLLDGQEYHRLDLLGHDSKPHFS